MDITAEHAQCAECKEPTKYPVGFWDGQDGGGIMFNCQSGTCETAQRREQAQREATELTKTVAAENQTNGIDIGALEAGRKSQQITVREMAERLHIAPSLLCDYQRERKAIPPSVAEAWREENQTRGASYDERWARKPTEV